jgi:hypothetical protein
MHRIVHADDVAGARRGDYVRDGGVAAAAAADRQRATTNGRDAGLAVSACFVCPPNSVLGRLPSSQMPQLNDSNQSEAVAPVTVGQRQLTTQLARMMTAAI